MEEEDQPAAVPRVPLHEAVNYLRKYEGKTDCALFLRLLVQDATDLALPTTWLIDNLDRLLSGDAASWWRATSASFFTRRRNNEDADLVWTDITRDMLQFFNHSSQCSTYRKKNKEIIFEIGDDAQSYVTKKMEVLRYIDANMTEERKVEHLISGLPTSIQESMAIQDIRSCMDFLSKLRRLSEVHANKAKSSSSSNDKSFPSRSVQHPNYAYSPHSEAQFMHDMQIPSFPQNSNLLPQSFNNRRSLDGRPLCNYCHNSGHIKRHCRNMANDQAKGIFIPQRPPHANPGRPAPPPTNQNYPQWPQRNAQFPPGPRFQAPQRNFSYPPQQSHNSNPFMNPQGQNFRPNRNNAMRGLSYENSLSQYPGSQSMFNGPIQNVPFDSHQNQGYSDSLN
jgi:hypothetical protein